MIDLLSSITTPFLLSLSPLLLCCSSRFLRISDLSDSISDGTQDHVFISKSYDAQSHFESVYEDVVSIYRRITGTDLKLQPRPGRNDLAEFDSSA